MAGAVAVGVAGAVAVGVAGAVAVGEASAVGLVLLELLARRLLLRAMTGGLLWWFGLTLAWAVTGALLWWSWLTLTLKGLQAVPSVASVVVDGRGRQRSILGRGWNHVGIGCFAWRCVGFQSILIGLLACGAVKRLRILWSGCSFMLVVIIIVVVVIIAVMLWNFLSRTLCRLLFVFGNSFSDIF